MDEASGWKRAAKLPHDVRCADCGGRGGLCEAKGTGPPFWSYNHCMQCVGTGLTPISSAEVINGRGTD